MDYRPGAGTEQRESLLGASHFRGEYSDLPVNGWWECSQWYGPTSHKVTLFLRSRPLRDHDCRNPSARTEFTFHLCPHRLGPADNILQHLIHNVLLEDAEVSIRLEIFL